MSRSKQLIAELFRYGASGGSTFLVEAGSFFVLHNLMGAGLYAANSMSYLIALAVNFLLLRYFVFDDGREKQARQQGLQFAALAFFNFFASNVLIGLYHHLLEMPLAAKCASIVTIAIWNFVIMRGFIFAGAKK